MTMANPADRPLAHPQWLAPAKLNLFLHLTGKIEIPPYQGYHALQTYFQLIDYGDLLQLAPLAESDIEIVWKPGDEGVEQQPSRTEEDLLYRAARLLKAHPAAHNRTLAGFRLTLIKNTPVGGGMGGGSSAAATTLCALNHFWNLNLDTEALGELGLMLGADVPVFLSGRSAWAEGIGDRLTPCPSPSDARWFVIVVPRATSLTHQLFAHPDLPRNTPSQDRHHLLARWKVEAFNAFEKTLLANSPEIRASHSALRQQTGFARVTGSGACLFSPVADAEEGRSIAERIQRNTPEIKRVIVAQAHDQIRTPCTEQKNI